ncbi:kanadaptin [Spea bombifrons]|uniref:kanadaptin n=1 Tax=Spea bombifrons TaxID=233779 RepID=UPI00234B0D55|nr:kanadaptin [Spea bombifrons]
MMRLTAWGFGDLRIQRGCDGGAGPMEATRFSPDSGEGPRDPGGPALETGSDAGAARSSCFSQDGVHDSGANQGSGNSSPRAPEAPTTPEASARNPGASSCEGSRDNKSPGCSGAKSNGKPRDSRASTSEELGVPQHETNETPDSSSPSSKQQWATSSIGTKSPHASASCGAEGPPSSLSGNDTKVAYGTSCSEEPSSNGTSDGTGPYAARTSPTQELTATDNNPRPSPGDGGDGSIGARGGTVEGPDGSRITEPFKKPTLPARSGGNEKTVEPRDKSTSSPSPAPSVGETSQDVSHRLPSDAYRTSPAIPYREPPWSGRPKALYTLEMLKGGSIVSTKNLDELNWLVIGRLPGCHISLEHPSVSRYHAVLQYRHVPGSEPDQEPGFYIYDLGSTHGTFLNKQRVQPKTYCRFRVGHVLKFGGSTRLFILQGPEDDQEPESELTVTQIKEARRQREILQKKMLGDDSDEDEEEKEKKPEPGGSGQEEGCTWGLGEDALEEDNDENPIAMEFQEDREALYLDNPKKTLQGFFDREGEELEFEYEERGVSIWLCRIRLPADDSAGKQLVAEAVHTGKKKDAAAMCALEACRMLDMRGLLRQEAVSRKRKSKRWEDEDFYDSDDDTFLDRTGLVEKKRLNRMKKAGKIEEKPETYDSLVAKLDLVDKELAEIAAKLKTSQTGTSQTSGQVDSLDAFMTEIKAGASLDGVTRKKLHLQSCELKKEQQRLKGLIKLVEPTKLPELRPVTEETKTKKPALPMFGAMKGGRKFKLKTGTVGKLPPKRTELPASFFTTKDESKEPDEEEEEEEEEEEGMQVESKESRAAQDPADEPARHDEDDLKTATDLGSHFQPPAAADTETTVTKESKSDCKEAAGARDGTRMSECSKEENKPKQRRMLGPSRPPKSLVSPKYPEDDPDYSVWTPPAGQTGDGRTHLNDKYGY